MAQEAFVFGRVFLQAHGRYETLREQLYLYYPQAQEALGVIPPGALIDFSPRPERDPSIVRICLRYVLYPLNTTESWDYFIDFQGDLKESPPGTTLYTLDSGLNIYTRPGKMLTLQSSVQERPLARMAAVFFLWVVLQVLMGRQILRMVDASFAQKRGLVETGQAYLTGCLALTASVWLYLLCGGLLQASAVLGAGVCGFVLLMVFSVPVNRGASFLKEASGERGPERAGQAPFILLGVIATAILAASVFQIVQDWDGMSQWVMKAKVLYDRQTLDFSSTQHNYYPILWPLQIAISFVLSGGMFDELAQWMSASFFLVFLTQLWCGLKILGLSQRERAVLLSCYLLAVYSWYPASFLSANAENMFLAFLTAGLSAGLRWLGDPRREKGALTILTVMFLGVALTKLEGAVTVLLLTLALVYVLRREGRHLFRRLIPLFLLPVLPALWIYWNAVHGVLGEVQHLQDPVTLGKGLFLLKAFWVYFITSRGFVIFFAAASFLALRPVSRPETMQQRWLMWSGGCLAAFAVFAGIGFPYRTIWGSFTDWVPRLLIHASPCLIFFMASRLGPLRESEEAG